MDDTISREKAIATVFRMHDSCDTYDITDYRDMMVEALNVLPSAQPEQRWIPTSKKLPEYDKPVLLSTAWGKTEIGFWTQRGWMIVVRSYRELEKGAVDAWMPLPEVWRGEQT